MEKLKLLLVGIAGGLITIFTIDSILSFITPKPEKAVVERQKFFLEPTDYIVVCSVKKITLRDGSLTHLEAATESGAKSFRGGAVVWEWEDGGMKFSNTESWGTVFDPVFGQYVPDPVHTIARMCLGAMKK